MLMRVLVAESLEAAGFAVSAYADAATALEEFDAVDPDALVTDIELGSRPNGAEAAVIARHRAPHLAVVFLTNYPLAASAPRAVSTVSDAIFLRKDSLTSGAELATAVDAALRQGRARALPRDDTRGSISVADPRSGESRSDDSLARLTRGQLEILAWIADGQTNAAIAERSGRSIRAVERMIARLFDTLGLSADTSVNPRVVAATRYARTFGLPATPSAPNSAQ